jgi:hypothetical protein
MPTENHSGNTSAAPVLATEVSPVTRRTKRIAWLIAPVLAVLATIQIPLPAAAGIDDSWQYILSYGFLQKLVYGRDLIFTFGPFGLLENRVQLPELLWPQLAWQAATRIAVVTLMAIWMRGAPRWVQTATFVATIFLAGVSTTSLDAPASDAFYMVGIWVAAAVLVTRGGRERSLGTTALALTLLAGFSLTKCSLTVAAIAALLTAAVFHALQRRFVFAAAILAVYGALCLVGWRASGQPFSALGDFARGALELIGGYTDAMATVPRLKLLAVAGLTAAVFFAYAWWQCWKLRPRSPGITLGLLTSGLLVLSWRHATCRADYFHFSALFLWVAIVGLLLISVPRDVSLSGSKPTAWPGLALAAGAVLIFAIVFPDVHFLSAKLRDFASNLGKIARIVVTPAAFARDWRAVDEQNRAALELPAIRPLVGDAELDVHGNFQAQAILGRYRYTPRPVPQSYAVITPDLAAQNASATAAKPSPFILLKAESIDERLPGLDDAPTLTWTLRNYRVAAEEKGFLLLARASATSDERLASPSSSSEKISLRLNEWFRVPAAATSTSAPKPPGEITYVTIDAGLTAAGKLARNFIPLRPPRLEVEFAGGKTESYNLPLPMGRIGFSLHPLIRSNADVVQWLTHRTAERVTALRLLASSPAWFYREEAVLTLTKSTDGIFDRR